MLLRLLRMVVGWVVGRLDLVVFWDGLCCHEMKSFVF